MNDIQNASLPKKNQPVATLSTQRVAISERQN